jgi:hypothetical protein
MLHKFVIYAFTFSDFLSHQTASQFGQPSNADSIEGLDLGYSAEEIERLRIQDVGEGEVKIRLFLPTDMHFFPWQGTEVSS